MAFPLHPETPEHGRSLEELFAERHLEIPAMLAHLRQTAAKLDLPFGDRPMTYNSRRAQELGKWAESENLGEEFHRAVFHAYFAEGLNIAEISVLEALAESVGLSGDRAGRVLTGGTFTSAVDADWHRSRTLKITAVPTFIHGSNRLVGAQPYERIRALVSGRTPGNP